MVQFTSYVRRVLHKTRLIFSRINGPIASNCYNYTAHEIPIILQTYRTKQKTKEFRAVLLMCYCSKMIEFSFSVSGLLFMTALIHTVSSSYFNKEMSFLTVVPVDIPRRTTDINLFGNLITRIQARTFAHLQACINLDLSNNDIAVIESNVFEGLLRLKKLVLDFNKLTEVRRDIMKYPSLNHELFQICYI